MIDVQNLKNKKKWPIYLHFVISCYSISMKSLKNEKKNVSNQCSPKGIYRGEKEKSFWNTASCIVHDFWQMLAALGNLL